MPISEAAEFDFDAHRRRAEDAYRRVRPGYEAFAEVLDTVLREGFAARSLGVASIETRAKSIDAFAEKAVTPDDADPRRPKYEQPLRDITDLAAARVITFFPKTVESVDAVLAEEFEILEKIDKADLLVKEERLGYQSIHYIVKLRASRIALPEYQRYANIVAEIQVRTILQHAWAEIEHDIQYKSVETIPTEVRRRFMTLAGLLEIADREFQAIQDEDTRIRLEARRSVSEGQLERVEITPDALKSYLDKKLGPDGRMREWSYEYEARRLRRLGFQNFQQLDECIAGYDDDQLSKLITNTRQGQTTRFEFMLMAGMGENFVKDTSDDWLKSFHERRLAGMRELGVPVRNYSPTGASLSESSAEATPGTEDDGGSAPPD